MAETESLTKPAEEYMPETITFETMPKAMEYLIGEVEALKQAFLSKTETPTILTEKWFNIDELKEYHPDHPAKATIYGWVSKSEIPYHKSGKKLRFLKSEIDTWLSNGKHRSVNELRNEANKYCSAKQLNK